MKKFSLPAELLKFSVLIILLIWKNVSFSSSSTGSRVNSTDDKELLMSIEELEKVLLIFQLNHIRSKVQLSLQLRLQVTLNHIHNHNRQAVKVRLDRM